MCDSIPRAWGREIQIGIIYVLLFKPNYSLMLIPTDCTSTYSLYSWDVTYCVTALLSRNIRSRLLRRVHSHLIRKDLAVTLLIPYSSHAFVSSCELVYYSRMHLYLLVNSSWLLILCFRLQFLNIPVSIFHFQPLFFHKPYKITVLPLLNLQTQLNSRLNFKQSKGWVGY